MHCKIRNFQPTDQSAVNALAIAAFEQYAEHYEDWPVFAGKLGNTASLAESGELIVAESSGHIVGAVAYIGPGGPKHAFFEPQWPIMRMLVVSPHARGAGIGRMLAQECIDRAARDQASVFALHTASIMQVALPMYARMGFTFLREASPIHGVAYAVYIKQLGT